MDVEYALPTPNPPIFENFLTIPHITDSTAVNSLSNITLGLNSSAPSGYRETYWTATYKVDIDLLGYMLQQYQAQVANIANVTGLLPAFVLQIITTDQLSHMSKYGGNALGLTVEEGQSSLFAWSGPSSSMSPMGRTCISKGMGCSRP